MCHTNNKIIFKKKNNKKIKYKYKLIWGLALGGDQSHPNAKNEWLATPNYCYYYYYFLFLFILFYF
jgi:hypothetical protein